MGVGEVAQGPAQAVVQFLTQARHQTAGAGQACGALRHQAVMGVDAVQVGVEGVGNLALAQLRHGFFGELKVGACHQPADHQHQPDHQAEQDHDRAFDW